MRAARSGYGPALAAVLAGALALRLWGLRTGLPYVYDVDEAAHFVPRAIGMFGHGYNPGYFANPPAFTYLLHAAFWVAWGGDGVQRRLATDPAAVFVLARGLSALLGTAAAGLLAWAGARLFGRAVGLVAAALLAVAFLPVYYGHLALDDAPALAPLCLALAGIAGVLRRGRARDHVLAGAGIGLAVATKYTAGVAVLALAAAALLAPEQHRRRDAARGLALAAAAAFVAFAVANPYALLRFHEFRADLASQSAASADAAGKLGLGASDGFAYYLGTLTWGLGWLPLLAAAGGAAGLAVRDRRAAVVLVPAPLVLFALLGSESRFFSRYLLPAYPFLTLLAAWGAVQALRAVARRVPRAPAWAPAALAASLLGAQGLVLAVHDDRVLARPDTRAVTRAWMVAHVPPGARIVVEPVVPTDWVTDAGRPSRTTPTGGRWLTVPVSRRRPLPDGRLVALGHYRVEDYERTLRPALLDHYVRAGACWVVSGSTQYGRALREPAAVPWAIRYYAALRRRATVAFSVAPWSRGHAEPAFSFDASFDARPLFYTRPGPRMVVFRLHGGRCH